MVDISVYEAIAAMAFVTLICRCAGYMIFSHITPSPVVRRALAHLPGCIFASYVIPALLAGPPQNWVGAAATMAVMAASRNLGLSIAAGVVAIFVFNYFLINRI
jgi:uncharacterized membrane protein